MNRRSIGFRLTAWYTAILTATLAAAGIGVWLAVRESIHDTVDKDLRARLGALRGYLERHPGPELEALAPAGAGFRIAARDGRWIYRSEGTRKWDSAPPEMSRLRKNGRARTVWAGGKPVRVLTAPVAAGAVQIGAPLDDFYELLDEFTWTALLASPLVLLLASAGGYWMSRRALMPVDRVTRTAQAIGAESLTRRLPVRGTGDELDRLSGTLNEMFGRLDSAFRRIRQFTADASHELRTPLAIMRTTAELARSKPRSEAEYEAALDRILGESERTTRLVEDLMLLGRADAEAEQIVNEPMDLAEVVREACAEAAVLAESGHVGLAADIPADCPFSGDSQALRRLFLILLDNAVKYTPPAGSVSVSMETSEREAAVEVRDTGAGIPGEHLPHIFERFYRTSKDRSRTSGGAGLGLSIAQWIVQRHGGKIEVESEPGVGSLFRVRLPRSTGSPAGRTATAAS